MNQLKQVSRFVCCWLMLCGLFLGSGRAAGFTYHFVTDSGAVQHGRFTSEHVTWLHFFSQQSIHVPQLKQTCLVKFPSVFGRLCPWNIGCRPRLSSPISCRRFLSVSVSIHPASLSPRSSISQEAGQISRGSPLTHFSTVEEIL